MFMLRKFFVCSISRFLPCNTCHHAESDLILSHTPVPHLCWRCAADSACSGPPQPTTHHQRRRKQRHPRGLYGWHGGSRGGRAVPPSLLLTCGVAAFAAVMSRCLGLSYLPRNALAVTSTCGVPVVVGDPEHAFIAPPCKACGFFCHGCLEDVPCCAFRRCGVATNAHPTSSGYPPPQGGRRTSRSPTAGASLHNHRAARSACPEDAHVDTVCVLHTRMSKLDIYVQQAELLCQAWCGP
jgi:hypothetical protein